MDKSCWICKFATIEEKADPYEVQDAIRCPEHHHRFWSDKSSSCKRFKGIYTNEIQLTRKKQRRLAYKSSLKNALKNYGCNSLEELKSIDYFVYEFLMDFKEYAGV